MLVNKTH